MIRVTEPEELKVPLKNNKRKVRILKSDFETLVSIGADPPWKLHQNKVMKRKKGRNHSIPRLLLDARAGDRIKFIDGDTCNLNINNLVRCKGAGLYTAREQFSNKQRIIY